MPVATRSGRTITTRDHNQSNMPKPPIVSQSIPIASQRILSASLFIDRIKCLLNECEKATGKENKMIGVLKVYKSINKDLSRLIKFEGSSKWMKFVVAVLDKIIEFELDNRNGGWHEINKNLVKEFILELNKTKELAVNVINAYNGEKWTDLVSQTKEKINKLRPQRAIPRVDYTGMDTIERECEDDYITDIWADLTVDDDSDYEYEEDKDDDEEELQPKLKKTDLSVNEKTALKQYLSKLIDNHRVKLNDNNKIEMDEYDQGQIYISTKCIKNGQVKYIWKIYSLGM